MKAADLRVKAEDELRQELLSLLREQSNLCFLPKEQVKSHDFMRIRRAIARIKGVLREKNIFL